MTLVEKGRTVIKEEGIKPFFRKSVQYTASNIRDYVIGYMIGLPVVKYKERSLASQANLIRELEKNDEWLLIVLDACRYDRFERVFDEYFEGEVQEIVSEGYNTFQYVRKSWPEYHDITYVTGAAPINATEFEFDDRLSLQGISASDKKLAERYDGYRPTDHIKNIVEVWRSNWDENLGVCPPEPVTRAAINQAKSESQLVVHYFQPHVPYIGDERALGYEDDIDDELKGGAIGHQIWERVQHGDISDDRLVELYDSNLERALDNICYVVSNTDFENVIIMGDHGESLGEYGMYGHPNLPNPVIRSVPWASIQATKKRPEVDTSTENIETREDESDVKDRLQSLGYI